MILQCILFLFFFVSTFLHGYDFTFEPIDVVIPCHEKDKQTLDFVIEGIQRNVKNLGRIIIVSSTKLSDKAEWFNESNYPFTKYDISLELFKDEDIAREFLQHPRSGWIFQQFLKVYALFVIPNISSNVLIVDADTVFLRPVEFQDPVTGAGLYNPGTEYHIPYFQHLERVVPSFKRVFPEYSGISHHMLFQRKVMEDIFRTIRTIHGEEPWRVFSSNIDKQHLDGSAICIEYEFYFNFVFARSNKVKIRHLKWANVADLNFEAYRAAGYDFVSAHSYSR